MLIRKLAIHEFGCRHILYLMFESLSIFCLYQNILAETICYSEIVKKIEKIEAEKEKNERRKECERNISVDKNLIYSSSCISLGNKGKEAGLKYSI